MKPKKVFVTVGTTKFPKLIDKIVTEDVLRLFQSLGYNFIQIQTGKDFYPEAILPKLSSYNVKSESPLVIEYNDLVIRFEEYFEDFDGEITSSDIVISHAGAGSCLDVLRKKKPLLVVINEDLMDNHQIELAEELQKHGYLYYSTCDTLGEALQRDFTILKPYPEPDKSLFPNYLDKCVGFV
ncbi:unnamed protein product [Phyllotreta striolata]|uniref:UDP-N-acetylglucosamine transferase subunit ALG13 n=1 Tax=Phyllotreta striolata TaxID=444603 RepID=A0A9N9TE87_PHYSR|nr:unnamed protein product [Phyllotreta striolata]